MADNHKYQEFLVEAEDIIQSLNTNLSQLQVMSTSSQDLHPDIVSELFGSIHTLKGMSSILGFTKIATLSHKLEDLLDNLRFGQIKITDNMVDTLSEGIDTITRLLTNISDKGEEYSKIDLILDKLGRTIVKKDILEKLSIGESLSVTSDLLNGLSDYEVHRVMENLKKGAFLFRIKASFSVDSFEEDLGRLQEGLKRFGEVIAFIPASGFSSERGISFEILLTSKEAKIEGYVEDIVKDNNRVSIQDIVLVETSKQKKETANNKPLESSIKSITRTVRVGIEDLDTLLNNVGEILLINDTIFQNIKGLKTQYGHDRSIHDIHKLSKELFKRLASLRNDLIEVRLVPISHMFDRLTKLVRKLCKDLSKDVNIEVYGEDNKLDKSMIERLIDPLMHIIRNAVDHGIEDKEIRISAGKPQNGTISLRSFQKGSRILIEVEDDGGGIDFKSIYSVAKEKGLLNKEEDIEEKELIKFLFHPGFSTTKIANEVSGRGVGLDVVARHIASLGGMIDVETEGGKGTKFSITVPLTLLIAKALIVVDSKKCFAIPFNTISENFIVKNKDIKRINGKETFNVKGYFIPLVRLRDILSFATEIKLPLLKGERGGLKGRFTLDKGCSKGLTCEGEKQYVVVVGLGEKRAGIIVDDIEGQREILLKPLSELLGVVPGIAGFTEIDAKRILPVIDVGGILERSAK